MEYLPLGSLEKPNLALDPGRAVAAVRDAALAAHALHERGIAHRDIKPANILIADDGGRLADLGLSQLLSPGMVMTGLGQIGLEFTDPPIMLGGAASRASDIWSLGACLHYALTGTGVYGDLRSTEPLLLVRSILASQPTLAPDLPPAAAELIGACLATDVTARPRTAAEVAERASGMRGRGRGLSNRTGCGDARDAAGKLGSSRRSGDEITIGEIHGTAREPVRPGAEPGPGAVQRRRQLPRCARRLPRRGQREHR